jgi:predicted anti-sigma-YlaC factor YlaD
MECREVQKRLSAYIEKVVPPKQKALIDAHLKGCKTCKRALADLKKAVNYVQKLEEVEPPAWLAQKVMTRVRSEAEAKRGILQKIFYPFHIKIPLEAVALILIAVGTIYIFHRDRGNSSPHICTGKKRSP